MRKDNVILLKSNGYKTYFLSKGRKGSKKKHIWVRVKLPNRNSAQNASNTLLIYYITATCTTLHNL